MYAIHYKQTHISTYSISVSPTDNIDFLRLKTPSELSHTFVSTRCYIILGEPYTYRAVPLTVRPLLGMDENQGTEWGKARSPFVPRFH